MESSVDPTLLKYIAGGLIVAVTGLFVWYEKLDQAVMVTLLTGAAAAIGFNMGTPS